MAILLGKSQCESKSHHAITQKFIMQFSTVHRQFIQIINNNLSISTDNRQFIQIINNNLLHYYWQFITLTTVNLPQLLIATYHNYYWQFITIIDGTFITEAWSLHGR